MRKNYHLSRSLQPDHQNPESSTTSFRTIEQYYKRRLWEPDYNLAFGHHSLSGHNLTSEETSPVQIPWNTPHRARSVQAQVQSLPPLLDHDQSPIKSCQRCPDSRKQAELIDDCLSNGLRKPNVTNIDTHWRMESPEGIYELYRTWFDQTQAREHSSDDGIDGDSRFMLQPQRTSHSNTKDSAASPTQDAGGMTTTDKTTCGNSRRQRVDLEPINSENFMVARNERPKQDPICSQTVQPIHIKDVWMKGKLRWCTIGWQYHWPTKTYHFDRDPTPISDLIQATCKKMINEVIPWDLIEGADPKCPSGDPSDDWRTNYKPEAGVINFYQYRDSLTAHIDHSEVSTDTPLVSLSMGHACIFLISPSRDEEPLAIKLESGDGLIMSGPSRRYFHSVPRIIEDSLPAWLQSPGTGSDLDRAVWLDWFREGGGRVNLNVRQVF